jgi:hypothetical protein
LEIELALPKLWKQRGSNLASSAEIGYKTALMGTTLDRFETVAVILSELADIGAALILISKPYTPSLVAIEVDDQDSEVRGAVDRSDLDDDAFKAATTSVAAALTVAIEELGPVALAKQEAGQGQDEEPDASAKQDAEKKLAIVGKAFDVNALRARAWVKKAAKHGILLKRSWEVTRKEADSDPNCPVGATSAPIGVLRVSSASVESPLAFLTGDGVDHLVATVDRADIRSLIRTLERLDGALAEAFANDAAADD